jgi:general secretion pathway protein D
MRRLTTATIAAVYVLVALRPSVGVGQVHSGSARGAARAPGRARETRYRFALRDAELPDLIRAVGNVTGRRFIGTGPPVPVRITVLDPRPLTAGEVWLAAAAALRSNGLEIVDDRGRLTLSSQRAAPLTPGPAPETVVRVFPLRHVPASELAELLQHLLRGAGHALAYDVTRSVVVAGDPTRIAALVPIVQQLDAPLGDQHIWLEAVHYSVAQELAERLRELFGASLGTTASDGTHVSQVIAHAPTNSLIIVANERGYLRIAELLRRLDVATY